MRNLKPKPKINIPKQYPVKVGTGKPLSNPSSSSPASPPSGSGNQSGNQGQRKSSIGSTSDTGSNPGFLERDQDKNGMNGDGRPPTPTDSEKTSKSLSATSKSTQPPQNDSSASATFVPNNRGPPYETVRHVVKFECNFVDLDLHDAESRLRKLGLIESRNNGGITGTSPGSTSTTATAGTESHSVTGCCLFCEIVKFSISRPIPKACFSSHFLCIFS